MRKYSKKRVIFIPIIAMLVVFAAMGAVGQWQFTSVLENHHRELTSSKIISLRELIRSIGYLPTGTDLHEFVVRESDILRARVTLIDSQGQVMADSAIHQETEAMGNLMDRPEVADAISVGLGTSVRYSETMKREMLYAAMPFEASGSMGIVRIAIDTADIAREVSKERLTFLGFVIFGLVVAAGLGIGASAHFSKQVRHEQEHLEGRVEKRTQEIVHLQTFGTLLSACKDSAEMREVIETIAPDLLPRTHGSLALYSASRNSLDRAANWGGEWKSLDFFEPDDCWALRTGRPHPVDEKMAVHSCAHIEGGEERNVLCIPMAAHGETIGVLSFARNDGLRFTTAEHQMAALMAEQISLAEANIKLRQSLREQAIRDPLTNLYNRRFLLESMQKEIRRAERSETQFVVLMVDVDFFKKFNDSYGHDAGDIVLSKLGQLFNKTVRGQDVACRYGGEEFTIILTDGAHDLAARMAERLCRMVRELSIMHGNTTLSSFSISVGCATYPEHGTTVTELLKQADEALYRAKENGRDRFEVAGENEAAA